MLMSEVHLLSKNIYYPQITLNFIINLSEGVINYVTWTGKLELIDPDFNLDE
jgi:hypothetical protein